MLSRWFSHHSTHRATADLLDWYRHGRRPKNITVHIPVAAAAMSPCVQSVSARRGDHTAPHNKRTYQYALLSAIITVLTHSHRAAVAVSFNRLLDIVVVVVEFFNRDYCADESSRDGKVQLCHRPMYYAHRLTTKIDIMECRATVGLLQVVIIVIIIVVVVAFDVCKTR